MKFFKPKPAKSNEFIRQIVLTGHETWRITAGDLGALVGEKWGHENGLEFLGREVPLRTPDGRIHFADGLWRTPSGAHLLTELKWGRAPVDRRQKQTLCAIQKDPVQIDLSAVRKPELTTCHLRDGSVLKVEPYILRVVTSADKKKLAANGVPTSAPVPILHSRSNTNAAIPRGIVSLAQYTHDREVMAITRAFEHQCASVLATMQGGTELRSYPIAPQVVDYLDTDGNLARKVAGLEAVHIGIARALAPPGPVKTDLVLLSSYSPQR